MEHAKLLEDLRFEATRGSFQAFAQLYDLTAGDLLIHIRTVSGSEVGVDRILTETYLETWREYRRQKTSAEPVMRELQQLAESVMDYAPFRLLA